VFPSFYLFAFVIFFSFNASGMMGKELSKERKEWLIKAHQAVPEHIKTMNEGVEKTATTVFKALADDDYSKIDGQKLTKDLDSAVKAASQVARRFHTLSLDSASTFEPEWQAKKGVAKYAKDTTDLLDDPKQQTDLKKNYSQKKLNALKKQHGKGKKISVRAHWKPVNSTHEQINETFWKSSHEISEQDDLDISMNKQLSDDQQKKIAKKKNNVLLLQQANLVWQREDGKRDDKQVKHVSTDDISTRKTNKKEVSEQQFSESFIKVLHRHNLALVNAARYKENKDYSTMLHFLYQAQAIKNILFSLPEYHQAKDRNSAFYAGIKYLGLADDLYKVHSFLADEKKYQLMIDQSLPTKEWIIFGCKLGKTVLNHPETIKGLFKQESMMEMFDSEVMKRYVAGSWVHRLLAVSSTCVDFFDHHQRLKAIIAPFGRYLIRPLLRGALSFTKHRLENKQEDKKYETPSLQNNLDGFALALKEEYQQTRKVVADNKTERYAEFLLKKTSLKDDAIAIPLSKAKAARLKEACQAKLIELEEEIEVFEHYSSTSYEITQEDERMLVVCTQEKEALEAEIKRANYWLQFHGEKIEQPQSLVITPIDIVLREHEQRKKGLYEQNRKLYEADVYDEIEAQEELEEETRMYNERLRQSRVFYAPQDVLFPAKNEKHIRAFIEKHSEEYRYLLTTHKDLLANHGISTETFLSLYVKAKLNKECGTLIAYFENVQNKFLQKKGERKNLEKEQEKLKQESDTFFKKSFVSQKRFFSFIYSFLVNKYNQWRINRNECAKNEVNDEVEALRKDLRELTEYQEYKTFDQMFHDRIHARYVQDELLEEKVRILASTGNSLFEYALWPDKRVKKQSASEILEKRKHRLPKFKILKLLPDYDNIEHVKVQRQKGAQCALYALLNGIAFCNNDTDFTKNHLGECRLLVKKMRLAAQIKLEFFRNREMKSCVSQDDEYVLHEIMLQIKDDDDRLETIDCDWLEPVESQRLKRLLSENLKTEFNNIILITDTSWYLNGSATIKLDEARKVKALQNALNNDEDCRFGIHLNTFCSSNERVDDGGHYIALLIEKKDGVITYKIANSYQEISSRDVFNNFMKLLWHYDFKNIVSKDSENEIEDFLRRLDFRNVFINKKLNQDLHNPIENVMENDKDPIRLINWVLKGAKKLFDLTHGEDLWTHDGFKDTKAVILDTLDAIEKAHNQSITLYPEGKQKFIILTDNQKERINVLKKNLEDMRD